ncbi:MAG: PorT family protein [Bacteroidales bacterium]|nr:PorT family protein [Bacteroidales bacterium]
MNKKICAILIAAVFTASVQAQFSIGARAGFNLTNFSEKGYDGKALDKEDKSSFKPGFQVGIVGDYAISEAFSIQPGLIFAQQGATMWKDDDSDAKMAMNLNYLQIPINAQYKLNFGSASLLLQAGPYVGFGIGGRMNFWGEDGKKISDNDLNEGDGEKDWFKIKFGSDKEKHDLKGLDFGVGLGLGVQFGAIQVGVGYNLGLMNLEHKWDDDYKGSTKNNGLTFTLTYLFGGGDKY